MADEAVVEHWVQELRELWLSWVRNCSLAGQIQSDNCDVLSLITYQLLLPKPEIPEINHALHYMLLEILKLQPDEVRVSDVGHFARRLQDWRATRPHRLN